MIAASLNEIFQLSHPRSRRDVPPFLQTGL